MPSHDSALTLCHARPAAHYVLFESAEGVGVEAYSPLKAVLLSNQFVAYIGEVTGPPGCRHTKKARPRGGRR